MDKIPLLAVTNVTFTKIAWYLSELPNVRNSTTLVNSLMNITIDLKFIFIIDAFGEYNSYLQDNTS